MYLIGYDLGSSSIKASIVNTATGETVALAQYPKTEMDIMAAAPGWAEQDPELWWTNICKATQLLLADFEAPVALIKGIGISYQMHGLVVVDDNQKVLRPSIIWCDSRAVEIGNTAFAEIGAEKCLSHLLNSPGNFTASKLKWVKDKEPEVYRKIDKMMLPGDFIAMKLTGEINTTISGLSEGMLWDFKENDLARLILDQYGIEEKLIPNIVPTFSIQGQVTAAAAAATGLAIGTPVAYRAGDQPNNALSLNVLHPGDVAATGGTSGVVYGVVDQANYDPQSRVNSFAHVNHQKDQPHIGVLLCINGAGIQYSWLKQQIAAAGISYEEMEKELTEIPIGADGLRIIPFGNGAERVLCNLETGAQINNLQFNRHTRAHLYRAGLEGIAFSFVYGIRILEEMGLNVSVMRVGNDNLFQSATFASTISNLVNSRIEIVESTGAIGAAKAAGVATGLYASLEEAMQDVKIIEVYEPIKNKEAYRAAYTLWENDLKKLIK